MKLDKFTAAYLECALWSSIDDDGEPLDREHDISDIATDSLSAMIKDCANFQESCFDLYKTDWTSEQAGHDFWLTRNGHGTGFWDRGFDAGDELTKMANAYGPCELVLNSNKILVLST